MEDELSDTREVAISNRTQSDENGIFRWIKLKSLWTWIKSHCDTEYEKKNKIQVITNWEDFADGQESGSVVWMGQGSMWLDTTQTDNKVWLGIYRVVFYPEIDKWSVSVAYYRNKTPSSEKIYINHIETLFPVSVFPDINFLGYRVK